MPDKPTTEQIETLLTHITDKPSERFYEKMENAPWNTAANEQSARPTTRPNYRATAAVAIVALMTAGLLFTPLGAAAQELLSRFFTPLPTNTQTSTITINPQPTAIAEAPVYIPQSLAQVQAQVGFDIPLPRALPPFYNTLDAQLVGDGVMVSFRNDSDTVGRNLVMQIHPLGDDPDHFDFEVGANAQIETVQIGNVTGEYVRGYWATDEAPTVVGENAEGQVVELEQSWNNDLGFQFLKWQADGFNYQIMFQETGYSMIEGYQSDPDAAGWLDMDDLVAIARSLR